jgi:hypothetical protein
MDKLRKRARLPYIDNSVYAYEYAEELILNEGELQEINQRISDTFESIWEDTKNAISHVFQDSGTNSATTATAAAAGMYMGGGAGALAGGATERGYACVNCHISEPVSQALSNGVDLITTSSDSTGN